MIVIDSSKIAVWVILIFCVHLTFAQNIEFKTSELKGDKKGLRLAKEHIKTADEIRENAIIKVLDFKDAYIEFSNALFYYKKAQSFNPYNANLNYKIGSSYLFTNNKEFALLYLQKALDLNAELPDDFTFYYAMALQLEGKYEDAIIEFNKFQENGKKKIVEQFEVLTKKYILECNSSKEILLQKNRVWVDNLPINTIYDDWSPCLSAGGDLLIFTSNRKNKNNENKFGLYDQDIYYSNLSGRNFKYVSSLSELNTINDDVSGGLAFDGQRLLIFKDEDNNTDVYESSLNGKYWGEPKRKMGEKLRGGNTDQNETFASFDPPDIKVYYISDGGYSGNKNIYYSGIMNKEQDIWGKGQSAGHKINTKYQEGSVYIHPDGRTMYFSSKGHNSLGGYDIFVSHVDDLGQWGAPVNLGYPINTPYDDLFYSATASGRYAYISSNRKGGEGGLDIYKVTYWGTDKPMNVDFEDQLMASIASPISDNTVAEPIFIEEKSLTVFKGKIIDAITKNAISADIEIILNSSGDIYTSFKSNSVTGKFLLSLPSGKNYGISVSSEGYLFHSENFNLPKGDGFNMVSKDIELKNIQVGSNITLRNVFFNTGKHDVKSDSYAELDRLVALLLDISSLKIEISGHTDDIGEESFNELLSQRRANSVVKYLVDKGVDKKRLSAKGYGSTSPVDSNNTVEGRAKNRRTEFEIIEN